MTVKRDILDDALLRIAPDASQLEVIADGLRLCEGPVWDAREGALCFTEIIGDAIWRWRPGSGRKAYVSPAGRPDGLALDHAGRVVVAGWASRSIWRVEEDGSRVVLASEYQGRRINTPNDVVVASDGSILWTDPTGGLVNPGMGGEDLQRYLDFEGVFRLGPDGEVKLLVDDFVYPNGLCFSPDGSTLYIDDTRRQHIRAFEVQPDGSLAGDRVFFDLVGDEPGAADGIKVDVEGNVYVTGPAGIQVCDPGGRLLGRLHIPGHVTNMGWGGEDWRWLHITTGTSVFRVHLGIPGMPTGVEARRA